MNIEVKNVCFSYDKATPILKNMTTNLGNESVAIIGQNGAGKTTFIRLLNNTFKADSGEITIDGIPVESKPLSSWAHTIGYVFQNPKDQLFQESVYKEIEFGFKAIIKDERERKRRVLELAEFVGLTDLLYEHPFEITYSKQKIITLASILSLDPDLILLDEPTAGQDWKEIEQFEKIIGALEQKGIKFITISHDMDFVARNFKRVLLFCEGEILIDSDTKTVFMQDELLKRSFVIPPVSVLASTAMKLKQCALTQTEFKKNVMAEKL